MKEDIVVGHDEFSKKLAKELQQILLIMVLGIIKDH